MKHFKKFSTIEEYTKFISSELFIKPNVSKIGSSLQYHKKIIYKLFDILYTNSNGNKKVDSNILDPSEGYIPIGLCVVETNFFGNNEPARFMSLKLMDTNNPNNGSLSVERETNVFGSINDNFTSVIKLCRDLTDTGYLSDITTQTSNLIPNLFDINGNWNLLELGEKNEYAITQVNGKSNSNLMIENVTQQPNWKTDNTIANSSNDGYYPAACCCWRYNTLGTQQGDWYLGGCGEIVMLAIYKDLINNKLSQISTLYPNYCISSLPTNTWFGTSTKQTNSNGSKYYLVHTNNTKVMLYGKTSPKIIAMLQY